MATREEKEVRIELPSTSSVECAIRESINDYVITFFQNDRKIRVNTIPRNQLNQDKMVDLLSDAGVEFFSFSAIFDVADLLIHTIREEFEEKLIIEEPKGDEYIPEQDYIGSEEKPTETFFDAEDLIETEPQTVSTAMVTIDKGDKLLKRFEMPYSQNGIAGVYYTKDGCYAVVLFHHSTPIIRKIFKKESIDQDSVVTMISESGIDFLSFSAIYDTAEEIEKIILHPEDFIEKPEVDVPLQKTDSSVPIETDLFPIETEPSPEAAMIDLSALDVSGYTKAEDFDKFLEKVKEFVSEGQPLPVREIELEKTGGIMCIILRKFDDWFIRFKLANNSFSELFKVKYDQDEIARAINQAVPQISFSYLYDASEKILKMLEQLSLKPMDDMISNVAVGHFLKVIEDYEQQKNLKAAAKITEVLLKRFRNEENAKGVLQFGKKLIYYLEERNKSSQAVKMRTELTEELIGLDLDMALAFVMDSLDVYINEEKYLNAANLAGLLLDQYLLSKDENKLSTVLMLARRQIEYYRKARLPVVLWENALRFARYGVQILSEVKEGQFSPQERESFEDDIEFMLDQAFEVQEEKKAQFDLITSLEDILGLFRTTNYKVNYSKYAERLILTAETQNNNKLALDVAKQSSSFLMDKENYTKACEFGNRAIKLFYDLALIDEAVEFSLSIVQGLTDLEESNAARDYLKFVESLIEKAYQDDESKRIEKQLALGDLFGKLGMRDRAKSFIQTALQRITDQKKREKIVLQYVDDLLSTNTVLTAQEMVNLELTRLLNEKKIKDVLRFCKNFIDKLLAYNQSDMVFEYMKYTTSLMIQSAYIDFNLLREFVNNLQERNEVDRAAYLLDQMINLQIQQNEHTRAIDGLSRFIDYIVNTLQRPDLVQTFVYKVADAYRAMNDPEGALERLIAYQKQLIDYSVELAQNLTDSILKELEAKEDFKQAIEVISRMIDKQIQSGRYQDAYIYCVQTARYYERLDDISQVIKYLEKMRDIFIEHNQHEDAARMTDLILRFGQSHKQYKEALNAVKNYAKSSLERGDTTTAAKFAIEMGKLLEEENKADKALEFLQMVFNIAYESNKVAALDVFKYILETRGKRSDFKKLAKSYLEGVIEKFPDVSLIDAILKILNPTTDEIISFSEKVYPFLIETDTISPEVPMHIINFIDSIYTKELTETADKLAHKYADKLIELEQVPPATRMMALLLEKTQKPFSELLPMSFNFIKSLIEHGHIEGAREFIDRVISLVSTSEKLGSEGKILVAKVTEKFAFLVAIENPDLASEYAYQASEFYRSMNDFKSVVLVFNNLADQFEVPIHSIRALKRGIYICKKYNQEKFQSELLFKLTQIMIKSHESEAITYFQQTLEKYEEMQDLDQLFNIVKLLIEEGIVANNLAIPYSHLDYLARLSSMINKTNDIGGIVVFLLKEAESTKDNKSINQVNKIIDDLGIKVKKFKKVVDNLERMRAVREKQVSLLELEILEEEKEEPEIPTPAILPKIISEPEKEPELVDTSSLIPEEDLVTTSSSPDIASETAETKFEDEFVSVIKTFEETQESAPKIEARSIEVPLIPSLDSVISPDKPIDIKPIPKIKTVPKDEFKPLEEKKVLEIPIRDTKGEVKTALSDDEISSLFSMSPQVPTKIPEVLPIEPELEEVPHIEEKIPEMKPSKDAALSESELRQLFSPIPSEKIESRITTAPELKDVSEDDEWEVDSFGRLWKKDSLIETPIDEPDDTTPDLSKLEAFTSAEDVKKSEIPSMDHMGVLEKALSDTQQIISRKEEIRRRQEKEEPSLFSSDLPESFSSIAKSLSEDEPSKEEPFSIPEVEYKEVKEPEVISEQQVHPPDLADLFSDALSELGGISGEKGQAVKDKKKKK